MKIEEYFELIADVANKKELVKVITPNVTYVRKLTPNDVKRVLYTEYLILDILESKAKR